MSEEELVPVIVKEGSPAGDDTFFWEELLADDKKDFQEEYLGLKVGSQEL